MRAVRQALQLAHRIAPQPAMQCLLTPVLAAPVTERPSPITASTA